MRHATWNPSEREEEPCFRRDSDADKLVSLQAVKSVLSGIMNIIPGGKDVNKGME